MKSEWQRVLRPNTADIHLSNRALSGFLGLGAQQRCH